MAVFPVSRHGQRTGRRAPNLSGTASGQVVTEQDKAALRSLFELKDLGAATSVDLYFGPRTPAGKEGLWIKTIPGKGWFTYFRVYGPKEPAFDGSWKPEILRK